jgi:hypothetical protein
MDREANVTDRKIPRSAYIWAYYAMKRDWKVEV